MLYLDRDRILQCISELDTQHSALLTETHMLAKARSAVAGQPSLTPIAAQLRQAQDGLALQLTQLGTMKTALQRVLETATGAEAALVARAEGAQRVVPALRFRLRTFDHIHDLVGDISFI